ncbi:MAG TPA: DUF934 domain-containing protein [Bordetella sp.]|nr:DUF934 domain-containing protein [Bordetella sp.]
MPDDAIAANETAAHLIRHGRLQVNDARVFVPDADTEPGAQLPDDEPGWIVPLPVWLAARDTLRQRQHPVAVLLAPATNLNDLVGGNGRMNPAGIAFIAIDFPVYTDGRGYSLAQLLRTRHGWQGELRALGDVMIDTIHYQARVGFDSFLVKEGHDPQRALAAFKTFTVHYQKTYPKPQAPELLAA